MRHENYVVKYFCFIRVHKGNTTKARPSVIYIYKNMKRYIFLWCLILTIYLSAELLYKKYNVDYVRWVYWSYCYIEWQEPDTIKRPIQHDTLSDCEKYLLKYN